MTDQPGKLVVISGPSGAGKTSVCRELKKDPRVEFSVSATTRKMRAGEQDGVDYHFMSEAEFLRKQAEGAFLESAEYNGNHYGTLREPMEIALAEGRVFILEIEVQGTKQLRDEEVDGDFIFIVPPSMEVLRERLERRGTNSPEEIENRLAIAAEEMNAQGMYDHVIPNHVLAAAERVCPRHDEFEAREALGCGDPRRPHHETRSDEDRRVVLAPRHDPMRTRQVFVAHARQCGQRAFEPHVDVALLLDDAEHLARDVEPVERRLEVRRGPSQAQDPHSSASISAWICSGSSIRPFPS